MSSRKQTHSGTYIRRADKDDLRPVQELYRYLDSLHSKHQDNIYTQAVRDPRYIRDALANPLGAAYCAFSGEDILGFAYAYEIHPPHLSIFIQQTYAVIDAVVVHPEHRRGGIGTRLVEAVKRWSKESDHAHMELAVYAFNNEALAFYRALGFETLSIKMFQPHRPKPAEQPKPAFRTDPADRTLRGNHGSPANRET